jgi:hypothetical protein
MGKKKDKSKFKASPFDYMKGGRIEKMGERYGVDKSEYNVNYDRNDGGSGRTYKGGQKEYEAAIAKAAMNDYDTRRTMEAQALSGKKKARKYAEGGFNNIEDVIKANNMRERWHKKAGNGGSFSSASDFAGQTMRAVDRERKKQTASYDAKYATKDDLSALEQQQTAAPEEKYEPSPEITEAKKKVADWESGSFDKDVYGSGSSSSSVYGNDDEQDAAAITPADVSKKKAGSMLEGFKQTLKERKNLQPTL